MDTHHAKHQQPVILVVEDDEATGQIIQLAISQETSYTSELVISGKDALNSLYQYKPDLLIIDYRLPDMTGIELYDRLQTDPSWKSIPALLVSATDRREEVQQRSIEILEKPFDLDDLLQTIDRLIMSQAH